MHSVWSSLPVERVSIDIIIILGLNDIPVSILRQNNEALHIASENDFA